MKSSAFCLFVVLMLGAGYVFGIPGYLDVYDESDGLCDGRVTKIAIDKDGVKWFGTWGGQVCRFDDENWETFEVDPHSSPSWVIDMALDTAGRVWVATVSGNVFYYFEDGEFHGLDAHPMIDAGTALLFAPSGDLYAGGMDFWCQEWVGRYNLSEGWRFWLEWGGDAMRSPIAFDVDPDGSICFATRWQQVYRLTERGNNWQNFQAPDGDNADIGISDYGRVWLIRAYEETADIPIIVYTDEGERWSQMKYPQINWKTDGGSSIEIAPDKGIWFGMTGGAFWFDHEEWRWIDVGKPADIVVDQSNGDVWFATWPGVAVMRGGPDAWPPVYIEIRLIQDTANPKRTASIMADVSFEMDLRLDFYLAVEDAQGNLLFAPDFSPEMAPMAQSFDVAIGTVVENYPLLELDLSRVPGGTYRWHAACIHTGTMEFASNIASCEWQFNR